MPNIEYTHSTEKAHDTTLDDEYTSQHVMSVVVPALSNQPIHFSDGALKPARSFRFGPQ